MQLTILGNSSGGPFHGRHYTAQVLQLESQTFLIDCGEGTQMQIFRYHLKMERCNHIFISHLHGDHVFGLIGMITNWSHKKRSETLHVFSPPGLQELIETTIRVCGIRLSYEIEFHSVDPTISAMVFETTNLEVWTIPLKHRGPTTGWHFREKPKPRHIRPEKMEEFGIHFSAIQGIKAGSDFTLPDGRVVPNAALTLDPSRPVSYAFCSDTAYSETLIELLRGVDLLYHEATYNNENAWEAETYFHSTAAQAAEIAFQAGVKRLILGHISGRYSNTVQHLAEARAVFAQTEIAVEGGRWEVGALGGLPVLL
jgi:ribonuclease Z